MLNSISAIVAERTNLESHDDHATHPEANTSEIEMPGRGLRLSSSPKLLQALTINLKL